MNPALQPEKKTATTFLFENGIETYNLSDDFNTSVLKAMEEYASQFQSEPVLNEGKGERPIEELFVEKYYGLSPDCDENGKINTDYGDLVNLLTMFKEETKLTTGYNKAIDDVLMVMCINPYHTDPAEAEIYGQAIKDKVSEIQRMKK